jgi:hypothetical protein
MFPNIISNSAKEILLPECIDGMTGTCATSRHNVYVSVITIIIGKIDWVLVPHVWNPSYSRGKDHEYSDSRPAQVNNF